MFYYSHHIGDFNNATRHLTRVERALYRDAIELYYETETPLIIDIEQLERRLIARSEEEKIGLKNILAEFFVKTDCGYTQKRCDEEIAKYRANNSNKAKAGIASAKARREKAATEQQQNSTGVEQVSNEPITNNHKPITINQEPKEKTNPKSKAIAPSASKISDKKMLIDLGVPEQVAGDYLAVRKAKRSPLTETAIAGITREAGKAGLSFADAVGVCAENGWVGFKMAWYQNLKPSTGKAGMSPETKEFFNTTYDRTEAVAKQRAHAIARGLDYDNISDDDLKF